MVEWGNARTPEALRIDGLTPDLTSYIAFYMEALALRELNWGRDILICTRNFGVGCNLVGEEEERVRTRVSLGGVSRLGGFYVTAD